VGEANWSQSGRDLPGNGGDNGRTALRPRDSHRQRSAYSRSAGNWVGFLLLAGYDAANIFTPLLKRFVDMFGHRVSLVDTSYPAVTASAVVQALLDYLDANAQSLHTAGSRSAQIMDDREEPPDNIGN